MEIISQLSQLNLDEHPPSVQHTKRVIKDLIKRFNNDKVTIVTQQNLPYCILYHIMNSNIDKVTVIANDVNIAKEISKIAYERDILREQLTRYDKSVQITLIIDSEWKKINVYDTGHLKTLKNIDGQMIVIDANAPFTESSFVPLSSDLQFIISVEDEHEFLV